jgi:hypothetical protein
MTTTALRPAPVSTDQFTWVPADKMFVAEASSLQRFERVWNDSCDTGLTLVSARTGEAVTFTVHHIEIDNEGDLLYWDLVPATNLAAIVRGAEHVRVRVFND